MPRLFSRLRDSLAKHRFMLLSLLLLAYLIVAIPVTRSMAGARLCSRVEVRITDNAANPFVTERELRADLGDLVDRAPGRPVAEINTTEIERRLNRIDKIESSSAVSLTDGTLRINVIPMRPVARVFDGTRSYYINKDGKRMSANARYHMDVPIITGNLDRLGVKPESLLPLVEYITADSLLNALVSAIEVRSPADVMLVPVMVGHVVNIGEPDPATFHSKFSRLRTFYTRVLPCKGWDFYDNISLKWRGQVVATRADHRAHKLPAIDEDIDESDDSVTMLPTEHSAPPVPPKPLKEMTN